MNAVTAAHQALDRLGVPRAEAGPDGDVHKIFTLAERIEGFWPYPLVELDCGHTVQGDPSKALRCPACR